MSDYHVCAGSSDALFRERWTLELIRVLGGGFQCVGVAMERSICIFLDSM